MEKNNDKQQMFQFIEQWKGRGQTQAAYCKAMGMAYHVFHYWYKVYRDEQQNRENPSAAFVPLHLKAAVAADTPYAELLFPNGKRLVFHHQIDLDIQGFFDNIDHGLLMKALQHYCADKWVQLYVSRWLKAGILQADGNRVDRTTGTPQGGVISPLLANIFLHVVFDGWMGKYHPKKPFVRYADDIVVHCKTNKQAHFVLAKIRQRLALCKLKVHPKKTRIVNLRGWADKKYSRSFDFLGFTFKPYWTQTAKDKMLLVTAFMSQKSMSSVQEKIRSMELHKWRKPVEELARVLNPIIRGVINYYCKLWSSHTHRLWIGLNLRLTKWVKWEKGLTQRATYRWLKRKYKEKPDLFYHWRIVHP